MSIRLNNITAYNPNFKNTKPAFGKNPEFTPDKLFITALTKFAKNDGPSLRGELDAYGQRVLNSKKIPDDFFPQIVEIAKNSKQIVGKTIKIIFGEHPYIKEHLQ